jgi:hypothetical protein
VPATSTLNFDPSAYAMANGTIVAVRSSGQVCVYVGTTNSTPGNAHVLLDVAGYLTGSGSALTPTPKPFAPSQPAPGAPVIRLFAPPFSGEFRVSNVLDHNVPLVLQSGIESIT